MCQSGVPQVSSAAADETWDSAILKEQILTVRNLGGLGYLIFTMAVAPSLHCNHTHWR